MLTNIKRTEKELQTLGIYLKGGISLENGIYSLNVDPAIGTGQIRCICFNRFMTSMEIDVTLDKNILVPLSTLDSGMLHFCYSLEGKYGHKFNDSVEFLEIEPLRPLTISSNETSVGHLLIRKDERLHLHITQIDRSRYMQKLDGDVNGIDLKLKELLDIFDGECKRYHLGRHNLRLGEHLKALENNARNNDLSSMLIFEGTSNLILSGQIAQLFQELRNNGESTSLSSKELQTIETLSDFIKNYPEIQHSIKNLCVKGGISSAKLQEGFKLMHKLTVSNFIRNVRLEKAEFLIRTSDLNISEVVYTIGLTSRSYFCKIFKLKYNCSPKDYRKKANVTHVANKKGSY